jgi:membrane-associated protease RseP (regulator of RpoE activity)
MARTETRGVWDTLLIVAVAALAVTFAHAQQAAAEEETEEGRIVELTDDGDAALDEAVEEPSSDEDQATEEQAYWLGIQGGPIDSPVLRTHLQLADDIGVVIAEVVPDSPAEKAGLRKHDVLLEVNGEAIPDMMALQFAVASSGGEPIELKLIRLAEEMTLTVTPEERPADLAIDERATEGLGGEPMNELQDMLRHFEGNLAGGVRVFGPGMIANGQRMELGRLPDGVTIAITREGDGPPQVTVQRGEETWTIEGQDDEALQELPEDLRAYVQKMLAARAGGGVAGFNLSGEMRGLLADNIGQSGLRSGGSQRKAARARPGEGGTPGAEIGAPGTADERILKRLDEIERRLDELAQRLEEIPAEEPNP